ncbi:MAG: hypothetical protein WCV63_06290 [Negativicutes bacterium]|jgi:hypothetical protein
MRLLNNRTGSLIVDGLVSAAIIGIIMVALFVAFGRSKDTTAASSDYVVAASLGQKYIEILKTQDGVTAFWANLTRTQAEGYTSEPNIEWNDPPNTVKSTQSFTPSSGNGFVVVIQNLGRSAHTIRVYAYVLETTPRKIARCKVKVTWTPPSVTGLNVSGLAKTYELFLENDYYMTTP